MEPGDEPPFPAMSPPDVEELTEAQEDKRNALNQEGVDLLEDGKEDLALEKFTEAISLGMATAMLYSRRAQVLFKMGRPRACVNDCNAALAVNPDSAKAYKMRARAYKKLEMWEEAHSDFQIGLKIDYDEQTYDDSLDVAAKTKEIQDAKVKQRVKEEEEQYYKTMQENKAKYEAGLKANEEKFREERMKEEEEKKKKEEERKERVRKREQEEEGAADESGVPKSHAPPEPSTGGAEDVD